MSTYQLEPSMDQLHIPRLPLCLRTLSKTLTSPWSLYGSGSLHNLLTNWHIWSYIVFHANSCHVKGIIINKPSASQKMESLVISEGKGKTRMMETEHQSPILSPDHPSYRADNDAGPSAWCTSENVWKPSSTDPPSYVFPAESTPASIKITPHREYQLRDCNIATSDSAFRSSHNWHVLLLMNQL